jgi:solute carrier family 25 protein 38
LWRGIAPSIARTVPGVGLYFGSLHWLKASTLGSGVPPSAGQAVVLGAAARTVAGGIMIPVTVIKTRCDH